MPDQEAAIAQLRRGVVELAILGLLAERQRYAQQIVDELGDSPAMALSAGTVYPLVSRLLKDGLIASTWQESPVGPPRKYYRLTSAGQRRLSVMAGSWRQLRDAVDQILKETR